MDRIMILKGTSTKMQRKETCGMIQRKEVHPGLETEHEKKRKLEKNKKKKEILGEKEEIEDSSFIDMCKMVEMLADVWGPDDLEV
jgi:hypothetical protein